MEKKDCIITENGKRASDTMTRPEAEKELAQRKKITESQAPATPPKLEIKQNILG